MKRFFGKWGKAVYLSIAIVFALAFAGCAEQVSKVEKGNVQQQVSEENEEPRLSAGRPKLTCHPDKIVLNASFSASVPAGVEIYRAEIKPGGKNGTFKRVGEWKDFVHEGSDEGWSFVYKDNTVKTGTAYAYKYKVYCKTAEEPHQYREYFSGVSKGMAANTIGRYACKVVKSTDDVLIVKLTGKSWKNGLLKSRWGCDYYGNPVELRFKNEDEDENARELTLMKYSYDGKKWHKKGNFSIKGKESVYLYFEHRIVWIGYPKSIKVTNYQYVQMFYCPVKYNYYIITDCALPQIRLNLSEGTAAVANFFSYRSYSRRALVWDGVFARDYDGLYS